MSIIFTSDLREIFTSVSGAQQSEDMWYLSRKFGLFHNNTHTNASFCMHLACWPQYISPVLEIITKVVRATWGVGERQGDFWRAYFPIVICAFLVKYSNFILAWELSLPLKIFSFPEGFCFLSPWSSLNKITRDCEREGALEATRFQPLTHCRVLDLPNIQRHVSYSLKSLSFKLTITSKKKKKGQDKIKRGPLN